MASMDGKISVNMVLCRDVNPAIMRDAIFLEEIKPALAANLDGEDLVNKVREAKDKSSAIVSILMQDGWFSEENGQNHQPTSQLSAEVVEIVDGLSNVNSKSIVILGVQTEQPEINQDGMVAYKFRHGAKLYNSSALPITYSKEVLPFDADVLADSSVTVGGITSREYSWIHIDGMNVTGLTVRPGEFAYIRKHVDQRQG